MTGIRNYAATLAELHTRSGQELSMYSLLVEHGTERSWSAHEYEYGEMGNCFGNAADLALWTPGLHYVEGLALAGAFPIPLEHAWVEDDDGNVIDNTWKPDDRDTTAMTYLGIRVPDPLLRNTLMRRQVYGVLEDLPTLQALAELKESA